MRYAAPADTSGITLSTGPLTVENGFIEVPDEASPGDLGGLAVNGFVIAPDDAPKGKGTARTTNAGETPPAGTTGNNPPE